MIILFSVENILSSQTSLNAKFAGGGNKPSRPLDQDINHDQVSDTEGRTCIMLDLGKVCNLSIGVKEHL